MHVDLIGTFEDNGLGVGLEGHTKFEKSSDDGSEVLEEEVIILGVLLNPRLHRLVLDESIVGGQHHQALGLGVLVLLGTVPFADVPLLVEQ